MARLLIEKGDAMITVVMRCEIRQSCVSQHALSDIDSLARLL